MGEILGVKGETQQAGFQCLPGLPEVGQDNDMVGRTDLNFNK
jgi:hypothetical protein